MSECELHLIIGCANCDPAPATPSRVRFFDEIAKTGAARRDSWTSAEVEFAEDLTLSDVDVSTLTGRTAQAVHMYRLRWGLVEKSNEREVDESVERAMVRWTVGELATLKSTMDLPPEDVAGMLGRSVHAVQQARRRANREDRSGMLDFHKAVDSLTLPRVETIMQEGVIRVIELPPLLAQLEAAISGTLKNDAASRVASAFERNILDGEALFEFMKISSAIGSWCRMARIKPTKVAVDDLVEWSDVVERPTDFHVSEMQSWERTILGKLDPVKTVEITEPCPVCESSAWQDADGVWHPRPVVVQYRRSNPNDTVGGWCRVEECGAVWEDLAAIRVLRAQIGDDPTALLAFLHK